VQTALDLELAEGTVVANAVGETACIFLAGLYRAERVIAERIRCLANGVLPWPAIDPEKALPWIEQKTGLSLAEGQAASIRQALLAKVFVITGGPGVGKTTIVNSILRILAAKGVGLSLCAPTGRAAKRMTEATGFEAKTIHRLLEIDPKTGGFRRDSDNPIECDLLVVDETSMVDVMLIASAAAGRSRHRRLADRRRHRPASIGRTRSNPGRHHRLRRGPDRPPDRGVPAGGGEPDHHQCAPDQPRSDAGSN
jgi:exodeoxyribonuclease V alpha subunit